MQRRGLTLIELVIVIAILAVLAAILLPAVQASREASRRTKCSSHLRQIALAIHSYEGQHGTYPPGSSGSYSYLTKILPFVEQQPIYDRISSLGVNWHDGVPLDVRTHHIESYKCPSDSISIQAPTATNYAGNLGYDVLTRGANGLFHPFDLEFDDPVWRGDVIRPADVVDGLSQTALVGELLASDHGATVSGPRLRRNWLTAESFGAGQHDEFIQACLGQMFQTSSSGEPVGYPGRGRPWLAGSAGRTMYSHCITPNQLSCENGSSIPFGAYTLASNHPQGVLVVFADGHVDFISSVIDLAAWRVAGTRAGREVQR